MYENLIFPEVETIYDYITYCNTNVDRKTYSANAVVLIHERTADEFPRCYFSCGCTGWELKNCDGRISTFDRPPFEKISVWKTEAHILTIDGLFCVFTSKTDADNFLEFANVYNQFIDKIIKNGVQESFLISEKLFSGELTQPIRNYINMLPQQFFVKPYVYREVLRSIWCGDVLFNRYVQDNLEEKNEVYYLTRDKSSNRAFREIRGLFDSFLNVISETNSISPVMLKLTCFLLIHKGAEEVFSGYWNNHYNLPEYYSGFEVYIEECVQKNMIPSSDITSISMLAYHIMSVDPAIQDDFYNVVQKVYTAIVNLEKQKQQNDFKTRLFQSAHTTNATTSASITDIDFLTGDEFEQLVCRLFQKMGFRARVTKHSGDQGIDVIAEKGTLKIGIQAKCYSSTVGNSAIQEAVAGKAFYGCNRVMVLTNSVFTKQAEALASANDVILWGRDILKEKLAEFPVQL